MTWSLEGSRSNPAELPGRYVYYSRFCLLFAISFYGTLGSMDQQIPDQQPAQEINLPVVPEKPLDDVEENKDMAALSYAWILSLVVFFTRRQSPFVRFHAKQGIILFILSIIFWMIPFIGKMLELIVLAFCAFGFIAAAQGQWKELPFIGAMARGD